MISAIVYILLGLLFTYLAINSGASIWSIQTLLPAIIATFDFGVGVRFFRRHFQLKHN